MGRLPVDLCVLSKADAVFSHPFQHNIRPVGAYRVYLCAGKLDKLLGAIACPSDDKHAVPADHRDRMPVEQAPANAYRRASTGFRVGDRICHVFTDDERAPNFRGMVCGSSERFCGSRSDGSPFDAMPSDAFNDSLRQRITIGRRVRFDLYLPVKAFSELLKHLIERWDAGIAESWRPAGCCIQFLELLQREFVYTAGAVRRSVHSGIVHEDNVSVAAETNIDFDPREMQIRRGLDRGDRVLRRDTGAATMTDDAWLPVA